MARNVEIKARIPSVAALSGKVEALSDGAGQEIAQDDTFFRCPRGRLKLRTLAADMGELIFYERPDQAGPKMSDYVISRTAEPDLLRHVLAKTYGVVGRVRKTRLLFMRGRTRIHLDRVEELGDFLELEVVLAEGEPAAAGEKEAEDILAALGVERDWLVDVAYVDMLNVESKSCEA